jgi:hypothetical protein
MGKIVSVVIVVFLLSAGDFMVWNLCYGANIWLRIFLMLPWSIMCIWSILGIFSPSMGMTIGDMSNENNERIR